jgi:hypothetical protein
LSFKEKRVVTTRIELSSHPGQVFKQVELGELEFSISFPSRRFEHEVDLEIQIFDCSIPGFKIFSETPEPKGSMDELDVLYRLTTEDEANAFIENWQGDQGEKNMGTSEFVCPPAILWLDYEDDLPPEIKCLPDAEPRQ